MPALQPPSRPPSASGFERWVVRLAAWTCDHHWLVLVLTFLFAAAATAGLHQLSFHDDYRAYFDDGNERLQALNDLQDTYSKSNNVLFALEFAAGEVFTRDNLAIIAELTERSWQLPYTTRVDSLTNFQHSEADGDELVVNDLVAEPRELNATELARKRGIAISEPALVERLVSPDGRYAGVNATLHLPELDPAEIEIATTAARELVADFETRYPGLRIYLTGLTMLDAAFVEASVHDIVTLVPIMYLVIIVTMILLFRSFLAMVATIALVGVSVATTIGLVCWFGVELTPPSASSPTMIMTLAVADAVHILNSMFGAMRAGADKRAAIIESMRINFHPILLTSVTTAIGFLAMNSADAPPFRHLGNITALGVIFAFLFATTFLPALLATLPLRAPAQRDGLRVGLLRLANFVIARHRLLLVVIAVGSALTISMIPRNELDDQFVRYFSPEIRFRADTDFVNEHLTGVYQLHYPLPAGGDNRVSDPVYLEGVDGFAGWLRAQPEVRHVSTITDVFKRLNMNMHGDDSEWYRLPDDPQLAAQLLLLYELSLPMGLDLNNLLDAGKSQTQLVATLRDLSSAEVRAFAARSETHLADSYPGLQTDAIGGALLFAEISMRTIKSMLTGTGLGLLLISVLMILALRSLRIGLLSMVPNLLPAGIALGAWGLLVGQVNMAVSVIVAMTLGIVVDDTVHFLSKYLRAKREHGLDTEAAIRYAFDVVGGALMITSFVLIAGFSVLILSNFQVNSTAAQLTALTLALALFVDFLLLPALLMVLDRNPPAVPEHAPAGTGATPPTAPTTAMQAPVRD